MTPVLITHDGVTNTKAGWGRQLGISGEAINMRLANGWSIADTLTTPRHGRRAKRAKRQSPSPKLKQPTLLVSPFEELKRQQLATQRQFNSMLRQFNRDLHALMSRSLDRGVVADLLQNANDRSTPIT